MKVPRFGGHLVKEIEVVHSKVMESGGAKRPRYSAEFKKDAVSMVIDGRRTIADVAGSLGLVEQTLGNWVRQARIDSGERAGLSTDERAELTRLRRENAQLSMERDLLKRATVFWVQESAR